MLVPLLEARITRTTAGVGLLAFITVCGACAADVTVDQSFPSSVRPYYQLLADDVWSVVQERFGAPPPLDLPIIVHLGFGPPITRLIDNRLVEDWMLPKNILVEVVIPGVMNLPYGQFAYQLGHELGHVMLNPRRTNGIIESIATALSYEVLDSMADQVTSGIPTTIGESLARFTPNFRIYRQSDEKLHLSRFPLDIRSAVDGGRWAHVTKYLRIHESEVNELDYATLQRTQSRDLNSLCAIALRSQRVRWNSLLNFAACTLPSTEGDPHFRTLPLRPSCIARLSGTLCRIGIGCGRSDPRR